MKQFLMGNQIVALAAKEAGAKIMFGYPITPSTEILETWIGFCADNSRLSYLQTEDEMAAGFAMIGACLSGVRAFTATAGPGNVLMQDAFSMAESLRVPTLSIITQRGGMSTSTVIYSQEEVRLTCFGGNGEGFRIVYSTSGLSDLYDYTIKGFQTAWRYRWPTFVLADGYQAKMVGGVDLKLNQSVLGKSEPILKKGNNLRNCFNLEQEIGDLIGRYQQDYQNNRSQIEEYQYYGSPSAQTIVVAHGIVSAAALQAVNRLKSTSIALFRPITLRPFPVNDKLKSSFRLAHKIMVMESSLGQLTDLLTKEYPVGSKIVPIYKPGVGFTPHEIYEYLS